MPSWYQLQAVCYEVRGNEEAAPYCPLACELAFEAISLLSTRALEQLYASLADCLELCSARIECLSLAFVCLLLLSFLSLYLEPSTEQSSLF